MLLKPFFTGIADPTCELPSNTLDKAGNLCAKLHNGVNSTDDAKQSLVSDNITGSSTEVNSCATANTEVLNSVAPYDYSAMIRRYNGTVSTLKMRETLPSLILFSSMSFVCLYFPWARKAYINLLCYGTLGAYVWLGICNVC